MSRMFEELDYRPTPMGALSLRRRYAAALDQDIYEIKLGEAFLMSSQFTASEIALAQQALARLPADRRLDVVVGGLGLGYTAAAVLEDGRVSHLSVIETLEAVIGWHREGLLPLGETLTNDARCRLEHADFFQLAASRTGFDQDTPHRRFDAILLDIDHSPDFVLDPAHASFYTPEGLGALRRHLHEGGVFGLWSNDAPDDTVVARLGLVFHDVAAVPVVFHNPLQDRDAIQTVYLAQRQVQPLHRRSPT